MGTPKTSLSYVPQAMPRKNIGSTSYLLAADQNSLPLYFSLKSKHDYVLVNREKFVSAVRAEIEPVAKSYDVVVIPQSSAPFLRELTERLPNVIELRKRNKADIIQRAQATANWGKLERRSQARCWEEMGDVFSINRVKSNQRKHYVPHLFEPILLNPDSSVLLLDDFIMSGNTIAACKAAMGIVDCDCFGVFYQAQFRP